MNIPYIGHVKHENNRERKSEKDVIYFQILDFVYNILCLKYNAYQDIDIQLLMIF